ncbi:hypothetical protein Q7689_08515, partial [Nocardiopsis tropica]|nr:hypothetical protein [Nocardiopsis tropica]
PGTPGALAARAAEASALDDVDGEAAARGLSVLVHHVAAGVAHGADDLVRCDGRQRFPEAAPDPGG